MGKDTVRAFVAIEINNPAIVAVIRKVQDGLAGIEGKIKFVEPENVHVTLKFLGDITIDVARAVHDIIASLDVIPAGGFDAELRGLGLFTTRDPRVVWVGLDDPSSTIARVQAALDDRLAKELGIPREKRKFEGHVTLARVKFLRDKGPLIDAVRASEGTRLGTQHVEAVLLKKSVLTPRGPIYSTLTF